MYGRCFGNGAHTFDSASYVYERCPQVVSVTPPRLSMSLRESEKFKTSLRSDITGKTGDSIS